MRRLLAPLGSALFLVIAPGTVAVLVPRWINGWTLHAPLLGFAPFRVIGVVLILAGLAVMLDSFARFALQGLGTPAPIAPPARLVVTGLYRHVRNPMYVALASAILGQGLLFGDLRVVEYGALIWAASHLFVLAYEEPALRAKFGDDYRRFCAAVPRWIPRLSPWSPPP